MKPMDTWLEVYPEFNNLKMFLEKTHGFTVSVEENCTFDFVKVEGNGIKGGFCTPNTDSYDVLQGRFVADNDRCFNKWRQCPLIMAIPCDTDKLMAAIKYLGSEEGFEYSNGFNYYDDDFAKLPHEINYDKE